eukprot:gene4101-4490_t
MAHSYEIVSNFLLERTKYRPSVGIILGSGLSGLSKALTETQVFKYEEIPGFPHATVPGHAGELVFGLIGNVEVVCMRGRFHFYEGNAMDKVVMPVRVMRMMGVKLLIVTNAAGGLNPNYEVGDIVVIQDHFGLPVMAGNTPLRGPNDDDLGPRFPAMSDAYDPFLQKLVLEAAAQLSLTNKVRKDGTYCFLSGPTYETRAECRFLRNIGDCVGMSTVPEAIAAKHCGMKVLGLSLITNKVIIDKNDNSTANHEEVLEAVKMSGQDVESVVKAVLANPELKPFLAKVPALSYPSNFLKKLAGEPAAEPGEAKSDKLVKGEGHNGGCCHGRHACCHDAGNVLVTLLGLGVLVAGAFVYIRHHHR